MQATRNRTRPSLRMIVMPSTQYGGLCLMYVVGVVVLVEVCISCTITPLHKGTPALLSTTYNMNPNCLYSSLWSTCQTPGTPGTPQIIMKKKYRIDNLMR